MNPEVMHEIDLHVCFMLVGLPQGTLREIAVLKAMRHDNVVSLLCVASGKALDAVFLIMEYCEHDLAAIIDNTPTALPEQVTKGLAVQLCRGVAAMHAKNIIHRDIKMSNLLLSRRGILKIADMVRSVCLMCISAIFASMLLFPGLVMLLLTVYDRALPNSSKSHLDACRPMS